MRSVNRSAIVPYTPEAMFGLVSDIEKYPEFLPWCEAAQIISREDDQVVAGLTIGLAGLRTTFTTSNALDRPRAMTMSLVDGPFSCLEGRWTFDALGDAGCKIALGIDFEFASTTQDLMFGQIFESICNKMIEAFTQRAGALYDGR